MLMSSAVPRTSEKWRIPRLRSRPIRSGRPRTRLAAQVAEEVRSHFGPLVLGSVIPRSVRVSEAPSYGQSVITYDPGSPGALAYLEAAEEMAKRNTQPGEPGR